MGIVATKRFVEVMLAGLVGLMAILGARVIEVGWKLLRSPVAVRGCACDGGAVVNSPHMQWLLLALGGLFVSGAVVGIIFLARTLWRTRHLVSQVVHGERLNAGVVLLNNGRCGAFTFGFFKPAIAMCAHCANAMSLQESQAVLAHEQCHVKKRDPLRFLVGDWLRYTFFFVPLIGEFVEQLRLIAELQADEGIERNALGQALVRFTDNAGRHVERGELALLGFDSRLSIRVERLLNPRWKLSLKLKMMPLLLAVVVVLPTGFSVFYKAKRLDEPRLCATLPIVCSGKIDAQSAIYYNGGIR